PPTARPAEDIAPTKELSQTQLVLRRFGRHRLAVASLVVFLLICAFAFLGPLVWKYGVEILPGAPSSAPPSAAHPFGTDQAGHDVLGQVIRGTQQSLKIALLVALMATTLGSIWGAVAGYYRGWPDAIMMR